MIMCENDHVRKWPGNKMTIQQNDYVKCPVDNITVYKMKVN